MPKYNKTLEQVRSGRADANVRFEDLRALLLTLGFVERSRGSHHVFSRTGIEEQINLQRDGAKAKPYQVKQVRTILLRYDLSESGNGE
jgi:predicted RNA binding protein YcfA (HicA-like mRNA interferase family)